MSKKIIVLTTALSFVFLVFTCGQDQPVRQRLTPAESAALLKEKLNLTNDQKDRIQKILEDQHEKMQKLRNSMSGDRTEMRESMRELRDETDQLIEELLTDEQKIKYEEYKEERIQNRRDRFRDRDE